jgi:N-methylhydantoinase A/oxoprolinase/acetone carboxylase beta subunit
MRPAETTDDAERLSGGRRPLVDCPVYARDTLSAGAEIEGPVLIEEYGSTTVMFTGDRQGCRDRRDHHPVESCAVNAISQDVRRRPIR